MSDRNVGSDETYRTTQLKREIVDNVTYNYFYDDVGNITEIKKGQRKVTDDNTSLNTINDVEYRSYTYDHLNQLTRENNKTSNTTTLFTYDGIGNIKTKKVYGYTTDTVGTPTDTITYRYGNDGKTGWNNLLTGVDFDGDGSYSSNETISYDAIGNPTSYLGNNLTWFGRQLTGYSNSNQNITYTYDADGYRASKTVNGQTTTYQYVNGMLVYECRPDMEIFYLYDSYNNLTGIRIYPNGSTSATNYYVTTNVQGDVLGIYNANGVQLAAYEYDAWGNVLSVTDTNGNPITSESHIANINPFRYRGYYLDKETGLYYLNSRYYNAEVGRFLNADGYVQTGQSMLDKNMFAYCANNPVMFYDPSGCSYTITIPAVGYQKPNIQNDYVVKGSPNGNNLYTYTAIPLSSAGNSSSGDLNSLQMHENAEIVYAILSDKGWSENAIFAVLGNMQHESVTINPGRYQNGGGPGYGIIQWDPATKYLDWALQNGYSADSLVGQVYFLNISMQPGYGEWFGNTKHSGYYLSYSSFISSTASVNYLTQVFLYSYERPSVPHVNQRVACAGYWCNYFR